MKAQGSIGGCLLLPVEEHSQTQAQEGDSLTGASPWGKLACHLGLHYRCDAY